MSELPEKQIKRLRGLIQEAETNLAAAKELLISVLGDGEAITAPRDVVVSAPEGKIIEGVFDGQIMIDQEGKNYPVPANYASKSKLVEGDIMKLTITPEGKFLYKQIGPVERKTVIGTLTHHDDKYFVEVSGKEYEVLYASVTYFRLQEGSQVAVTVVDDNKRNKMFGSIKKFTQEKNFFLALIGVIALAISVNIVELACSAGLPVMFIEILSMNHLTVFEEIVYIGLYMLFFLIDDLIIFFIAMTTMQLTGFSTKYGKISKVIGGLLLLLIGLLLIFKPEWLMFNF